MNIGASLLYAAFFKARACFVSVWGGAFLNERNFFERILSRLDNICKANRPALFFFRGCLRKQQHKPPAASLSLGRTTQAST